MQETDEQLIRAYVSEGNEDALATLIARHTGAIYHFVYRLVKDRQEAEDITQETFVKVWRNLKRYIHDTSFTPWLFTIARNTTLDHLRKKKMLVFSELTQSLSEDADNAVPFEETLPDEQPLPQELLASNETATLLSTALDALPFVYREVLVLRYKEDFSFGEIATILGRPENTVKSQCRRGLQQLREKLLAAPIYEDRTY